jgi:hypothetical protein
VYGSAINSSGYGVYGLAYDPGGTAGGFNSGGGKILSGQNGGVEKFSVGPGGDITSAGALLTSVANNTSTGTANAHLAKLDSSGNAVKTGMGDNFGILGVVVSGGGTSGNAQIAVAGQANCVFNLGTTAGDYVQSNPSGMSGSGTCRDAGSTYPTTGQVLGRVLSTNVNAGTYPVFLFGAEQLAAPSDFSGALQGDVTGTQTGTVVVGVNGSPVPISAAVLATNPSGQLISGANTTLPNNITGNAATVTNGAYVNYPNTFTAEQTINSGTTGLNATGTSVGVAASGANGVSGTTTSSGSGSGIYGYAGSSSGNSAGVYGKSDSSTGRGVYGSGVNYGVYGDVTSGFGIPGVFNNPYAGKILSGQYAGSEMFSVDVNGNVAVEGAVTTGILNNDSGTTNYFLAKVGAGGGAVQAGTSDSTGILGVVVSGGGKTGSAQIAVAGSAPCAFDGSTTAGDYVQASSTSPGACHDAGASYPSTGQVLGRVSWTNAGAGEYYMYLFGAEQRADAVTNVSNTFTSTQTITSSAASQTGLTVTESGSGSTGASIKGSTEGVYALATGVTGTTYGVYGASQSTSGTGVVGIAFGASGSTTGVLGVSQSPAGTAGVFNNTNGGAILAGQNNGTNVFGVDGSGKVTAASGVVAGINASSQSAMSAGTLAMRVDSNLGIGPNLSLYNYGGVGSTNFVDFYTSPGSNPTARLQALDHTYSSDLLFHTKVPGSASNALSERMRITNAGNVGIGTAAPSQTLDVNGNANVSGNLTVTGTIAGATPSQPLNVNGNANISGTLTAGPGGTGTPFAMATVGATEDSNGNIVAYGCWNTTKNITGCVYSKANGGYSYNNIALTLPVGVGPASDFNPSQFAIVVTSNDINCLNQGGAGWVQWEATNQVTIAGALVDNQCALSAIIYKF